MARERKERATDAEATHGGIIYGVSPFQESGREASAGQKSYTGVLKSRIFLKVICLQHNAIKILSLRDQSGQQFYFPHQQISRNICEIVRPFQS